MQKLLMHIILAGKGIPSEDWFCDKLINIQRFYYIKSGKGWIIDPSGERIPFTAGKIYLFPYNYAQRFETDSHNPIDHIFVDFISNPPIIAMQPIIYDVEPDSPIMNLLKIMDSLFIEHEYRFSDNVVRRSAPIAKPSENIPFKLRPAQFSYIDTAEHKSYEEYKQSVYLIFQTMLVLLSYEKEIPLSNDDIVNRALEYFRSNFREALSVEDFAKSSGISVNHFINRFKHIMGITPYAYLKSYRLNYASELILQGRSYSDVSEEIGYSQSSSLSRALNKAKKQRL